MHSLASLSDATAAPLDFDAELAAGTDERYRDAALYDLEYGRRHHDVAWYRKLAHDVADGATDAESPLRVVELGCGSGRLLVPLARDGHWVCGIDRNESMLRACQKRLCSLNAHARTRVHILQSDFREIPLAGRFRLILCPFNAFMHLYSREDVERCLSEVRRLLAPDGVFALDVFHPDPVWLARSPMRRFGRARIRHPRTGERLIQTTSHVYDPQTQMAWIRFYYEADSQTEPPTRAFELGREVAGGATLGPHAARGTRVVRLAQRLFFPAELEALLHYNGFAITYRAGGFDGSPLCPVSSEQVICARIR
ncbi:MAG: class I SAM-dependent methyltransferase [Myxococcales bacterium]|nr:class I SAM-dependent methyltransferase [Myxococcales bacterium]